MSEHELSKHERKRSGLGERSDEILDRGFPVQLTSLYQVLPVPNQAATGSLARSMRNLPNLPPGTRQIRVLKVIQAVMFRHQIPPVMRGVTMRTGHSSEGVLDHLIACMLVAQDIAPALTAAAD